MDEQTSLLISRTKSHAELRAELENLVIKDMLGHAGGPEEEITERSVRDRYLVGMLAPLRVYESGRKSGGRVIHISTALTAAGE